MAEPANPDKIWCGNMIAKWHQIKAAHPERTDEANAEIARIQEMMKTAPANTFGPKSA